MSHHANRTWEINVIDLRTADLDYAGWECVCCPAVDSTEYLQTQMLQSAISFWGQLTDPVTPESPGEVLGL